MKIKILAITILSLSWFSGCRTTDVVHQESAVAKQYFQKIKELDLFPSVGSIRREDDSLIGSGVLVSPSIVLTAGHVIDDASPYYFSTGKENILIKETIQHPYYSDAWGIINNDIGLILLETSSSIDPISLHIEGELVRGTPLITVGYGRGYKKFSLPSTFFYYGTLLEDIGQMKFLPLKDTIWYGDSGGAVFGTVDDKTVLVGIMTSFRIRDYIVYENSASKVYYYKDWILETIKKHG